MRFIQAHEESDLSNIEIIQNVWEYTKLEYLGHAHTRRPEIRWVIKHWIEFRNLREENPNYTLYYNNLDQFLNNLEDIITPYEKEYLKLCLL